MSAAASALEALGWSESFANQVEASEDALSPCRVSRVHRSRLAAIGAAGLLDVVLPHTMRTSEFAVGDWLLVDLETGLLARRLPRRTLLQRRTEGGHSPQLAAANVDTLFIVTSCNADFNPARLERYLALANGSGAEPVMLLTKPDAAEDAEAFRAEALSLQRDLPVLVIDARAGEAVAALAPWCGAGRTIALIGSSGVGKSTLVNALSGGAQETGGIREHDAKGRHTTTGRSLHPIRGGGWVIDTPGMRTLLVADAAEGIDTLFAEITELAPACRFRDCTHDHEPGCAVRRAVEDGTLDPERLARWRKLEGENRANSSQAAGARPAGGRGRRR